MLRVFRLLLLCALLDVSRCNDLGETNQIEVDPLGIPSDLSPIEVLLTSFQHIPATEEVDRPERSVELNENDNVKNILSVENDVEHTNAHSSRVEEDVTREAAYQEMNLDGSYSSEEIDDQGFIASAGRMKEDVEIVSTEHEGVGQVVGEALVEEESISIVISADVTVDGTVGIEEEAFPISDEVNEVEVDEGVSFQAEAALIIKESVVIEKQDETIAYGEKFEIVEAAADDLLVEDLSAGESQSQHRLRRRDYPLPKHYP